ncbi:hypothetical protein IWQ57_001694 [Coemansia nantahalensis]|uniref:Uncharacterized protein n=1 Tax=Coemansia nantahalensis TaxID=2789366 RepID=A0ACC1K317_9FUNG|nr:hypothetical protein IWQ57_001694 [Coemansia nantahalensis]
MATTNLPALGCYLAVFCWTREWVLVLCAAALAYYRNAMAVFVIFGACCCAVVAKALKRILRQERPPGTNGCRQRKSYGMPSSHSASVIYFATLLSVLLADVFGTYVSVATAALAATGVAAALYRVKSGHHTVAQVAAGGCLGWAFALAWWACRRPVLLRIEAVAAWAICAASR